MSSLGERVENQILAISYVRAYRDGDIDGCNALITEINNGGTDRLGGVFNSLAALAMVIGNHSYPDFGIELQKMLTRLSAVETHIKAGGDMQDEQFLDWFRSI